jgi:hypothetical protein
MSAIDDLQGQVNGGTTEGAGVTANRTNYASSLDPTMGIVTGILGGVGSNIGSEIGYGIGNLTGYNQSLRNDQLGQQDKLDALQQKYQWATMDKQYSMESPAAQVQRLKDAGLNPALMYGSGGGGGATSVTAQGTEGASASNESERRANDIAEQGMAIQNQKMQSEIAVNNATAAKLNSEVPVNQARKPQIEAETQGTIADNFRKGIENHIIEATQYNNIQKSYDSMITIHNEADKSLTELNNANLDLNIKQKQKQDIIESVKIANDKLIAETFKDNEQAKAVWGQLVNATKEADAKVTEAMARKLETEFNTGNYTNWKTWAEMAKEYITAVGTLAVGASMAKGMKKPQLNSTDVHTYDAKGNLKTSTYSTKY